MRYLGIFVKYLLWSLFSIIVFLLLVGLAKSQWKISTYVQFLNANDWSVISFSHPNSRVTLFWPTTNVSGDIADILDPSVDSPQTGLDVYDPAMEEELNMLLQDSLSGDQQEAFGFTWGSTSSDSAPSASTNSKAELYNLIQQHELQK